MLPEDYVPGWLGYTIATVIGAGGLQWFRTYLENKRLGTQDFRELLLDRIRELETKIEVMHDEQMTLGSDLARLESENEQLRKEARDATKPPSEHAD